MPVSPLTPLSLVASVNLQALRAAFEELEKNHGFYCDEGALCCGNCASSNAWKESAGKPFAFWHEQNEDRLHIETNEPMNVCFGIAKEGVSHGDVAGIAGKIINAIQGHGLICEWDNNINSSILVHLDKALTADELESSYLDVSYYMPDSPSNDEFKEFIEQNVGGVNECNEYEPQGSFQFFHPMEDGESLLEATMRLPLEVRAKITHYQRNTNLGDYYEKVEPVLAIGDRFGHAGAAESLHDLMEMNQAGSIGIPSNPFDVNQKLVDITGSHNRLIGVELLAKINELDHANKTDLVRSCGYWSRNEKGKECLYFTEFYEALLAAKGATGHEIQGNLDNLIPVGENLELTLTKEYTEKMGLEPEDLFYLTATGDSIILFVEGSNEIDVNCSDCDFCAIVNSNNEIHIPSNLAAEIGCEPGDSLKVRQGRSIIKLSK